MLFFLRRCLLVTVHLVAPRLNRRNAMNQTWRNAVVDYWFYWQDRWTAIAQGYDAFGLKDHARASEDVAKLCGQIACTFRVPVPA